LELETDHLTKDRRRKDQRVAECVEWLGAFWELHHPKGTKSANPHLLNLLRFTPGLGQLPALELVASLSRERSRDQLIKEVVRSAHGQACDHPELFEALWSFSQEAEARVGAGFYQLIAEAREQALEQGHNLAGVLDPATDLEEITGERPHLRVVLSPSVFLPPPQAGRHGALLQEGDGGWVAYLMFGLPLRHDPQRFYITRPWLLGGGWHYAIVLYLERFWPSIAERILADPDFARALAEASGAPADRPGRPWTSHLEAHVNVALKCLLSRQLGVPDAAHQAFAKVSGLRLFPWFKEWLLDGPATGSELTAHLTTLPEALRAGREGWERLAKAGGGPPPAINLALISASAKRAALVVPDAWPDPVATAAVAGWRLLPAPLMRYSEWITQQGEEAAPVIAFGEPETNPLVKRVLEQCGLGFESLSIADPSITALAALGSEEAAWCIAVAAKPESAARLRIETALDQTSSYFIADGGVVVDRDQAPLEW
jgi:hypothetical protein